MKRSDPFTGMRERTYLIMPLVVVALLVVAGFWAAFKYVRPEPPRTIVIATASKDSPYWKEAERYRDFLKKNEIELRQEPTSGSFENLQKLRAGTNGVQAGILQGGIANGTTEPGLRSIGRIGYEPVWIFHRGERMEQLSDLRGKRILVGPEGGGTNFLATRLLAASGVNAGNSTLIAKDLREYPAAFEKGEADVGFLVLGPGAVTIRRLLRMRNLQLMSLAQAEAIAQRFPFLESLTLKHGVLDLAENLPARDVHLVATLAALVVREDMHPALANLLTQAVVAAHDKPVIGPNGEAPVFESVGRFPITTDPEFPMSEDARRIYKSGPPFLQRYLPFHWATLIDRLAVLLLPLLGLAIPALRIGPMLYTWRVKRRLMHWYKQLKLLERGVHANPDPEVIAMKQAEIDAIEVAVNEIKIPLAFSDQLYNLRNHIDIVRRRLTALSQPLA